MVRDFPNTQRAAAPEPIRVMVVDDNAGFRESLVSLLDTDEMIVVGEAESGSQALGMVERANPDVVLMDVRMPEMNGIETTRRLKQRYPDIEIVALTGLEDQTAVREMLVAGASGYVLKDSDGDEILHAVVLAAAGGGVISPGVTPTVIEELTEALERERRRSRELEISQKALIERSARRQELVSRIGHELRTPVTVIFGIAQTLAGDGSLDERAELMDRLVARSSALAKLIERFEGALEAGLTEWADVTQVAREVAVDEPRIQVEAPAGPTMATMNRTAAARIISELVENALAFSKGRVLIQISSNGHGPEVRIQDSGSGVAPGTAERIFEPMEQGEELNTRVHQGAGLGLTIARMSARAMDGDVLLEQTGPEGSTFLWRVSNSG